MSERSESPPHPRTPLPDSGVRARSIPYRGPFIWAQIFTLFNYCATVALLTSVVLFVLTPNPISVRIVVACVIVFFLTAVVSFLKRRHVLCPLCKGAPLVNSKALVHSRATRIFPLDYGTSAMLFLVFSQTFRCMYCGARFDLLKPRQDLRSPKQPHQDSLS